MRTEKMRGLKRKTRNLIHRIEEETLTFPLEFYNGYWNLKLPVAQDFISSSKTPYGIKKLAIKALLDKAEHFVRIKPTTSEKLRVVVMIESPGLWNSQIIVFSGDSHFEGFFDRNEEFQKWIPINVERSFEKEWDIKIPDPMKVLGFKEEINDGDGYIYKGELWFIGEIIC